MQGKSAHVGTSGARRQNLGSEEGSRDATMYLRKGDREGGRGKKKKGWGGKLYATGFSIPKCGVRQASRANDTCSTTRRTLLKKNRGGKKKQQNKKP